MGALGHDAFAIPSRVVLAREQPFGLGIARVEPATRQIVAGGDSRTVEPRVMQVLVALFRAEGEIVTRDELIEWCWNGRIVGDDAVNRTLSRIRQLASGIGAGSFIVETIPRVGYRLRLAGDANRAHDEPAAGANVSRRSLIAGACAASAVAAAGSVLFIRSRIDSVPAEARQLYDRAEALASTSNAVTSDLVIPYLQEAVWIAPDFGEAWGFLALAYRAEIQNDPSRATALEPRIAEAAANALRLSPGNADADAAVRLREWHYGRWQRVEPVYRGLIERHPQFPVGYHLLGHFLMDVGRWRASIEPLRTARNLEPLAPVLRYKLSVALWSAGRISDADDETTAALRRWPRHSAIWQTRVKLLTLTGRPLEALALLEDGSARPLDEAGLFTTPMRLIATALASGSARDRDAALAHLRSARPGASALYCAALGDVQLALDMLEGTYLRRGPWARTDQLREEATHPLFQPHARSLWKEPRFAALLSGIGLEQYWRLAGAQPDFRRFA